MDHHTEATTSLLENDHLEQANLVAWFNEQDYTYLSVPIEAHDIEWSDEYIVKKIEDGKYQRNIFYDVEFDEFETQKIQELKDHIISQDYHGADGYEIS